MTQKYRLVLPFDVGSTDLQWEFLEKINGKVVKINKPIDEKYVEISQWNYAYPVFKVRGHWLEPIEEGPVSVAELYATVQGNSDPGKWGNKDIGYAIKISAENDRKRTQPVIDAAMIVTNNASPDNLCKLNKALFDMETR